MPTNESTAMIPSEIHLMILELVLGDTVNYYMRLKMNVTLVLLPQTGSGYLWSAAPGGIACIAWRYNTFAFHSTISPTYIALVQRQLPPQNIDLPHSALP
jgi:hypothetical protein